MEFEVISTGTIKERKAYRCKYCGEWLIVYRLANGMLHVDDDDLDTELVGDNKIKCTKCEAVYIVND